MASTRRPHPSSSSDRPRPSARARSHRRLAALLGGALALGLAGTAGSVVVTNSYEYDDAGRLVRAVQDDTEIVYVYDLAGNPLTTTVQPVPEPKALELGALAFLAIALLRRGRKERDGSRRSIGVVGWVAAAALGATPADAQEVSVCMAGPPMCDFATIQEALDNPGAAGMAVVVSAGTYMEGDLLVTGRTLRSESPTDPGSVTIDGSGIAGPVLSVNSATVMGMTLRGGNNVGAPGGGVRMLGGTVLLQHLIIEQNASDLFGGGVGGNSGGDLTIDDCDILTNTALISGGGVDVLASVTIRNSLIDGNSVTGPTLSASGGGIAVRLGHTLDLTTTIVSGNRIQSPSNNNARGGGLFFAGQTAFVADVDFIDNEVSFAGTLADGGGIYTGGGGTFNRVEINQGLARRGGGIFIAGGPNEFNSVSVRTNTVTQLGGGVFCVVASGLDQFTGVIDNNSPDETSGCTVTAPSTGTGADSEGSEEVRDPINTFTGEFLENFAADIELGGPLPLRFSRYYASRLEAAGVTGTIGSNWRHSFEWSLTDVGEQIDVLDPRGRRIQFDDIGMTGSWTLAGQTDIAFQLVEETVGYTLYDPRSRQLLGFDDSGRLISVSDTHGNTITLTRIAQGELLQAADGLGRVLSFTHTNGLLTQVSDGTRAVTFAYVGNDLVTSVDTSGNTTSYSYASPGLLSAITHPETNARFTQAYDGLGRVTSQLDSQGNQWTLAYSGNDTLISDPNLASETHTYNATGQLTSLTDKTGLTANVGSEASGRRNSVMDRLGNASSQSFDATSGYLATRTRADGSSIGASYTPRVVGSVTAHDLTGFTNSDGTTLQLTRDAAGNLASFTDAAGASSTFTYDASGQVLTATNPLGGTTTRSYNADGTVAAVTDASGNTTTFSYDSLRRISRITHADLSFRDYTYDDRDRVLTLTDENGGVTSFGYTSNGNLASITDATGATTAFAHDASDRITSVTLPDLSVFSRSYNANGDVASVTDANNNTTAFGYDTNARLTSITSPLGIARSRSFDAEGVLASKTDGLGQTTTYASDNRGRITSETTAGGKTTALGLDSRSEILSITNPLGGVEVETRDARGLRTRLARPGGAVQLDFLRDAAGNITGVTDPNGNVWPRAYDNQGRLTSTGDPLGNMRSVSYDNRGRLETVTLPGSLGTQTYSYDALNNIIGRVDSDGVSYTYTHDAANRLIGATGVSLSRNANGAIDMSNGMAVGRDAGGRITSVTLAPGKSVQYVYDIADRLVSVTDWLGNTTGFVRDDAGRVTTMTRPNGVDTVYTYDADGAVMSQTDGSVGSFTVVRDAMGRVTSQTRDVPMAGSFASVASGAAAYDDASRAVGTSHDDASRVLDDGSRSYTWSVDSKLMSIASTQAAQAAQSGGSQLVAVSNGAAMTSFGYDALGHNISRSQAGVTIDYALQYAFFGAPAMVERQGAIDSQYNIFTPGGQLLYIIETLTDDGFFPVTDPAGNVYAVLDGTRGVVNAYDYTPLGDLIASFESFSNGFRFGGAMGARSTGSVVHNGATVYDSNTGRKLAPTSASPVGPKADNPMQVGLGNPANDPFLIPNDLSCPNYARAVEGELAEGPAPFTESTRRFLLKPQSWFPFSPAEEGPQLASQTPRKQRRALPDAVVVPPSRIVDRSKSRDFFLSAVALGDRLLATGSLGETGELGTVPGVLDPLIIEIAIRDQLARTRAAQEVAAAEAARQDELRAEEREARRLFESLINVPDPAILDSLAPPVTPGLQQEGKDGDDGCDPDFIESLKMITVLC